MVPTKISDQIHQDFLKDDHGPWKYFTLNLILPPVHHLHKSPLPCRETPEEHQAASRSLLAGTRELFKGLQSIQLYIDWRERREKVCKPLIDPDGLHLTICIRGQDISVPYEESLPWLHRVYHSHRLHLIPSITATTLAHITWITKLTIDQAATTEHDEGNNLFAGVHPFSLRTPLELAARLTALQVLNCP